MKKFTTVLFLLFILSFSEISLAQYYSWRYREHATDCTALIDGKPRDLCFEVDDEVFYKCEPSAGDCDTAGEWKVVDKNDHGVLVGLGDDDHSQYALLAGRDAESLAIDEIKAYDGAGLKLYDDGSNGVFVEDGGNVGIGTTSPNAKLDVNGSILITNDGTIGSVSDTDAITISSNGAVTFSSTRVGTSEGSNNSIIGSAFGSKSGFSFCNAVGQHIANSATGNVYHNSIIGDNIANAVTGNVNYNSITGDSIANLAIGYVHHNSITGHDVANSATGNIYHNSITGNNIANAATGNVYRNSITGKNIATAATGDVYRNSIIGENVAQLATGEVSRNSITGDDIANAVTGNVSHTFSIGRYNICNTTNETNVERVIALPYESLKESSASDLDDAIAIGYRAGYQNAYNSPALFGREATAGADKQMVLGSSFYTGGTALMGGDVGVGATSPDTLLHIYDGTATSTLYIESGGAGLGGRIIIEDTDGAGCTVLTTLNGVLTAAVLACP